MDQLYDLGLAISAWLQTTFPQAEGLMGVISFMGSEEFFLLILPVFYWNIDKRLAKQLGYLFLMAVLVLYAIKHMVREPRPYWIDPAISRGISDSYGFPSGHVTLTLVLVLFMAAWVRRWWAWLLAIGYVLLMGVSRLYLGVHFPQDAIGGIVLGGLVLLAFALWQRQFATDFGKRPLGRRMFVVVLIPLVLASVYTVTMLIIGAPDLTVPWASHIPLAELESMEGVTTGLGALLGFAIGITLEGTHIRFRTQGTLWQHLGRLFIGFAGTLALWAGLDAVFPSEPAWLALPLRVLRYMAILLWVTYFAPWFFVRLGLADVDPEPEFRVTL